MPPLSTHSLEFAGEELILHPLGALFWPDQNLLAVSDLHLEKGSSFTRYGRFLPPYDTRETLEKLQSLIAYFVPERIVFLGDTFHDPTALRRMSLDHRKNLARLGQKTDIIWIGGNHDRGLVPDGEQIFETLQVADIFFSHIATQTPNPEISGHYHPAAVLHHRGGRIRRPCFAVSQTRIIMPSFGAFTGGLDVTHPAFTACLSEPAAYFLLGTDRIFHIPSQG